MELYDLKFQSYGSQFEPKLGNSLLLIHKELGLEILCGLFMFMEGLD